MAAIPESYDENELACNEDISSKKKPDRRWLQVQWHVQKKSPPETMWSIRDPFVRRTFLAELYRRNPMPISSSTASVNADIFAAIELGQCDSVQADTIRAYLLAGQTTSQVATLVGVREDVITWFESLFFDVVRQLEAYDWVWAQILVPADRAIDECETGSPEFALACHRAVLFYIAFTGGIEILKRIVRPAAEVTFSSYVSPLNNSPYVRILTWLWSSEISLPTYVDILERFEKLMKNSATFSDLELDRRVERLWKFIERHIRKRASRTKQTRRVRKTDRKVEVDDSDFLSKWLNDLITPSPRESAVDSRAQSKS